MLVARVIASLLLLAGAIQAQPGGYVDSRQCETCHRSIYASYQRTGMGRSFSLRRPLPAVADFYHAASDTHYSMLLRDGKYYQRRWQTGFDGNEDNVDEMSVDAVLGSGNHALTFLHRTPRGTLLQLPLGWYAEKGGLWGMNPGYDAAHPPARRRIPYECMFCHNAYPPNAAAYSASATEPVYPGELPEGIDCQRCHGPGSRHIVAARRAGTARETLRRSILNPARLTAELQMEVCLQCHLETTSTRLPGMIRRLDRTPFSYIPGEPLASFSLFFDHAPDAGRNDKFEIAGSAYRLRQSLCFLKSAGALTCTSCHNPHDIPHSPDAPDRYAQVCRGCHAASFEKLVRARSHPANPDCIACHMPRRRTEDVVHVVVTDHLIQRRPPARDLLASLAERHPAEAEEYRGEVVPYYPSPGDPLYNALAQVYQKVNLSAGIPRLAELLNQRQTRIPEFFTFLGDAYQASGKPVEAIAAFEQARALQPDNLRNLRALGLAKKDASLLRRAVDLAPDDAESWFQLGIVVTPRNRAEGIAAMKRAVALDPDRPELHYDLGQNLAAAGDGSGAELELREAIRVDPSVAVAHTALATLLSLQNKGPEALFHAEKAVRLEPAIAPHRYEYALILVRMNRFEDAEREARAAVQAEPGFAEAHQLLGGLLIRRKSFAAAVPELEAALRLKPGFSRAHLDLASALAATGNSPAAIEHLREAAKSPDDRISQAAAAALRQLHALP